VSTAAVVAVPTRERIGVAATFFVQGLLFITLTTHLPQTTDRFSFGSGELSLVLLGVVLLAGVGSVVAEQVAQRADSATALRTGLAMLTIGLAGFALLPTAPLALGVGAVYAVGLGMVDAAGNMQAVALEHRYGRPILPSFHGCWTAGGIVATLLALATGHLGPAGAVAPLAAVALVAMAAPMLARDRGEAATSVEVTGVPWRRIVLVGIALVLFYMVDTASSTWGPVYLHHEFGTALADVAIATLPYLVATLAARLAGDWAVARFGVVTPLRAGSLVAAAALAVIVFAPTTAVAVGGFTLLGLGAGVVAPLSFSAAASIAGGATSDPDERRRRVDAVIARFNQFNYVGALLGAVVTGLVGAGSLRVGFALPMVVVLGIWPLAKAFAPAKSRAIVN